MTKAQTFDDWLNANYLFDTSNFIKDEADREKAKASNPTRMAWQHQQQRIDELESKLKIAVDALKDIKRYGDCELCGKESESALKQIEVKRWNLK